MSNETLIGLGVLVLVFGGGALYAWYVGKGY